MKTCGARKASAAVLCMMLGGWTAQALAQSKSEGSRQSRIVAPSVERHCDEESPAK